MKSIPTNTFPTVNNNGIIDLDLSATKRKKFRFDHDDNRIVELNTSDMNISNRLADVYPKLQALEQKAKDIADGINTDSDSETTDEMIQDMKTMGSRLTEIDREMREYIDYLFDAPVSEKAAPDGSMYDPFAGMYRYEYIITVLVNVYETNLKQEYEQIVKQMKSHTDKYIKR